MWFKALTGFDEVSPAQVRENLLVDGMTLHSKVNGRSYQYGRLEIPTLDDLKSQVAVKKLDRKVITVQEIVGDVQQLHIAPENEHALFQAASQFNLLEMVGPHVTPEQGIDRYEHDHTQGPACAIACGAGTIYRNYFVPLNGNLGQTANHQIDCLEEIGQALNNPELHLWKMTNGYALANREGLFNINAQLDQLDKQGREQLKGKLRIGLQWDTEVTLSEQRQVVSQAYCSALPVAYSQIESPLWEPFARIILEATYEATFYAALSNLHKTGCNKLYLTLVGGGAFGNRMEWILDALAMAVSKFKSIPLEVSIVSYGLSNPAVRQFVRSISEH